MTTSLWVSCLAGAFTVGALGGYFLGLHEMRQRATNHIQARLRAIDVMRRADLGQISIDAVEKSYRHIQKELRR